MNGFISKRTVQRKNTPGWLPRTGLLCVLFLCLMLLPGLAGCSNGEPGAGERDTLETSPQKGYVLDRSVEVNGRQGVCCEGNHYWVSGSTTLTKYDRDWNVEAENTEPFEGFETEVNHIGDIDVYENELYAGVEYFEGAGGQNIQIAVYDADTLELKRSYPFEPDSGQKECSGIAVDPDHGILWLCAWTCDISGRHLYKYDLKTGEYLGKVRMRLAPDWVQGIAYYKGEIYITADDGDADEEKPDHIYKTKADGEVEYSSVVLEKVVNDVTFQGEIEGLTFDKKQKQLLLLYNRGAHIVNGIPDGFYPGYDREISEVFIYDINKWNISTGSILLFGDDEGSAKLNRDMDKGNIPEECAVLYDAMGSRPVVTVDDPELIKEIYEYLGWIKVGEPTEEAITDCYHFVSFHLRDDTYVTYRFEGTDTFVRGQERYSVTGGGSLWTLVQQLQEEQME